MDSNSTEMPTETTATKKPGDAMFLKPCEMTLTNKPSETIPAGKIAGRMRIKPCDMLSERSMKKRRVITSEEEEEEKKEEQEEEVPVVEIEEGKHVDVKALLSSKTRDFLVTTKGGEIIPVANLEGKYVLVCCFLLPFGFDSPQASACLSIEALCSELSLQGKADEVKLVIVGKIDPDFTMSNFDSFFSSLSVDCLAIPFFDTKSRDRVCESLDFCTDGITHDVPCLAVHPSGEVLQLDSCFLDEYGCQSFPFTSQHFDNIFMGDQIIRDRLRSSDTPISFSELLQCDRLSRIGDENNPVKISDLGDTVVALYLYFDGKFLVKLQEIHQKCLDEGRKLEIVLVPIPFDCQDDRESFYNVMKQSALKNPLSSSWLAFPFNDKICRALRRLFYCFDEDLLIILPHGTRPGDFWGKHIATSYGVDAYPFTRDVIIERKVNEIRSITLEQFLGDTDILDFRNKNILLYLGYPTFDSGAKFEFAILNQDYCEFKVKYPGSEVVFVPLSPVLLSTYGGKPRMCETKRPILPYKMRKSVEKHIYGNRCIYPTLVTIGKDGKVLSCFAQYNHSLFDDTLASEILRELEEETR